MELAFEFHRFFDLVRTGRAVAVLSSNKGIQIAANKLLFPIPLSAIDANPNLTQNP
ncbi:SusD family protein [compost metagenome]